MLNLRIGRQTPPDTQQPSLLPSPETIPDDPMTEAAESSASSGSDAAPEPLPSHFDDLIGPEAESKPSGMMLDRDQFHALFCAGFNTASFVTRLESLRVDAGDKAARGASSALYDTILDIPALHFVLNPEGKWLERAALVAAFAVPMSMSVKAELAARSGRGGERGAGESGPPIINLSEPVRA